MYLSHIAKLWAAVVFKCEMSSLSLELAFEDEFLDIRARFYRQSWRERDCIKLYLSHIVKLAFEFKCEMSSLSPSVSL